MFPQKAPGSTRTPNATAGLPLEICGDAVVAPSYIYTPSPNGSVLKDVKVTVTLSPTFTGQIVTVSSELLI